MRKAVKDVASNIFTETRWNYDNYNSRGIQTALGSNVTNLNYDPTQTGYDAEYGETIPAAKGLLTSGRREAVWLTATLRTDAGSAKMTARLFCEGSPETSK